MVTCRNPTNRPSVGRPIWSPNGIIVLRYAANTKLRIDTLIVAQLYAKFASLFSKNGFGSTFQKVENKIDLKIEY
jgi:hypothetical protein